MSDPIYYTITASLSTLPALVARYESNGYLKHGDVMSIGGGKYVQLMVKAEGLNRE